MGQRRKPYAVRWRFEKGRRDILISHRGQVWRSQAFRVHGTPCWGARSAGGDILGMFRQRKQAMAAVESAGR